MKLSANYRVPKFQVSISNSEFYIHPVVDSVSFGTVVNSMDPFVGSVGTIVNWMGNSVDSVGNIGVWVNAVVDSVGTVVGSVEGLIILPGSGVTSLGDGSVLVVAFELFLAFRAAFS